MTLIRKIRENKSYNFSIKLGLVLAVAFSILLLSSANQKVLAVSSCTSTPTDRGTATTTVNIGVSGDYVIWSRIKASSSSNDSYILRVDNQCVTVGDAGLTADQWTWVNYQDGQTGNVIRLNLSAGNHTVTMAGREDGVGLDRLLFLSDTSCVPTGTGENCAVNDTTAPSIQISYPKGGDIVRGSVEIASTISDMTDVSKVDLLVDGALSGTSTTSPYSIVWDTTGYSNTTHSLQVKVTDPSGNTSTSDTVQVSVNNSSTSGITSRIEAENYNDGGEGVGYHDTTAGNLGDGTCRSDDVDMKVTSDIDGGCTIGYFDPGEWLEYDIDVKTAGVYDFTMRIAEGRTDGNNGQASITLDGSPLTDMTIPITSSWDIFTTVWKGSISLPSGQHTLRISSVDFFDLNWFAFTGDDEVTLAKNGTPADTTPPTKPSNLTTTSLEPQSITLSWNASSDSESGIKDYIVYKNGTQLSRTASLSFTDSNVSPDTTYNYSVSAVDNSGNESAKASLSVTTPPIPSSCLATDVNQDGTVTITDAVAVILRLDATGTAAGRADVNGDGTVTITDAVAVILDLDKSSGCTL